MADARYTMRIRILRVDGNFREVGTTKIAKEAIAWLQRNPTPSECHVSLLPVTWACDVVVSPGQDVQVFEDELSMIKALNLGRMLSCIHSVGLPVQVTKIVMEVEE